MTDLISLDTPFGELDQPAMIVDIDQAAILEINDQARRIWGLGPQANVPIALDPVMPALGQIGNRLDEGGSKSGDESLVFWTAAGAQSLRCTVQPAGPLRTVLILVEDSSSSAPSKPSKSAETQKFQELIELGLPDKTAAMAHELRTPMAAIIALAEMIEREQFGPIGDPRYREYARDIGDSARLSLGIVAVALEQEGSDDGVLLGGFAEIGVAELIDKCCRAMQQIADQAGVSLFQNVADDLPNLIANAPALTQIMLNLLSNAIKFTPERGVITIEAAMGDDGGLTLAVNDTGVGMTDINTRVLVDDVSDDKPPKGGAMAEGNQLSGDTGMPQPTRGIGFSLVRRLALAMEARLAINSTRGVGTRVGVSFPPEKVIPVAASSLGR